MSNFIQRVNVKGLSATSLIGEALARNGVKGDFLKIPDIRAEIIESLKNAEVQKNKYRTTIIEEDLIDNIDEMIPEVLEIKPEYVRILGNRQQERVGEDRNVASTKRVSFRRVPKGIKRIEDVVTKVYANNMPEICDSINYMEKRTSERIFGEVGETVQRLDRVLVTRDNVSGKTKLNRSFENVEVSSRKETRVTRNKKSKEYATLEMYQEVKKDGQGKFNIIKIKQKNYRLKGDELVDLIETDGVEKVLFMQVPADEFYNENISKLFEAENEQMQEQELLEEFASLDVDKRKIAMKLFGDRVQEGIGENE